MNTISTFLRLNKCSSVRVALIVFVSIAITSISNVYSQKVIKKTVLFEEELFFINQLALEQLNEKFEKINDAEVLQILVEGHAGKEGSSKFNQKMSENRMNSVVRYFTRKGINPAKITSNFYGDQLPVADHSDLENAHLNRRVDVTVEYYSLHVGNPFEKLKKQSQIFWASVDEEVKLRGKAGTIITIPAKALDDQYGKPAEGLIKFELIECYNKTDFLMNNLHSFMNPEIMETGGILYFSASQNGKKLKLSDQIQIEFASQKNARDYEIFVAEKGGDELAWNMNEASQFNTSKPVNKAAKIETEIVENGGVPEYKPYYKFTSIQQLGDVNSIKNYSKKFKTNELGWISCNQFAEFEFTTDLLIDIDTKYKPTVKLILQDFPAILPSKYTLNDKLVVNNAPIGYKATLVALSYVNGEPYYASKEVLIDRNQTVKLILKKTTQEELRGELEKVN